MGVLYGYRCRSCGATRDSLTPDDHQRCPCGGTSRRDYRTVQLSRPGFQPHFNHSVGEYVSSQRQFESALKRKGEEAGSSYIPLDPGEVRRMAPSTDSESVETARRIQHDSGTHDWSKD